MSTIKSGRTLRLSGPGETSLSKCVPAVEARWPPAENPIMPTRSDFIPHSASTVMPAARPVRVLKRDFAGTVYGVGGTLIQMR